MTIAAVSGQNGGATAAAEVDTYAFGSNVAAGSLIVICGMQRDINGGAASNRFVAGDCTKLSGTAVLGTIQLDVEDEVAFISTDLWTRVGIWSAIVTTGGSLTMQVSNGSAAQITDTHIHGHEFSGNWDSGRLEASNSNATATDDLDPATGNATSAGIGLFVGCVHTADPNPIGLAEDAAFTVIVETSNTAEGNSETASIYRISTGALTDQAEWVAGGNKGYSSALAVYAEAAGGLATPHSPFGLPLNGPFTGPV